ncbi:MAG: DUF58 domain-containing protein [Butyrivibrio sp.]|nr:DUF58 domain-containing protein [Muribaculum sp.]MCM1552181.1 DUF58 domain-containing protein [Butyrivibrio sp.]
MIQLLGIGIIAALLFWAQQKIYKRLWNRHLRVDLAFGTGSIFEGEYGVLREVVENHKRLPISMLKVKFTTSRSLLFENAEGSRTTDRYYRNDVFQIGGGERITRTLQFLGGKRGYYNIDSVDLVATDLFMSKVMVDTIQLKRTIYVYPKPFESQGFRMSLQELNGEVLTKRHLLEDPFEYRGVREYEPFDDMRSINWKATAKTGELKVNQRSYTALESVRIFLNVTDNGIIKNTVGVEAGIQMMAGLSEFFLGQGFRVACYTNGVDTVTGRAFLIETNGGKGQMEGIYRGLARLDLDREPEDFRGLFEEKLLQESGGMFTCFICPNQYDDFVALLEEFQAKERDYMWFYPVSGLKPPKLPATLQKHIRTILV